MVPRTSNNDVIAYGKGRIFDSNKMAPSMPRTTPSNANRTGTIVPRLTADDASSTLMSASLKATAKKNTNNKNHTNDNDPTGHNDNLWEDSEDGSTPTGVASILSATVSIADDNGKGNIKNDTNRNAYKTPNRSHSSSTIVSKRMNGSTNGSNHSNKDEEDDGKNVCTSDVDRKGKKRLSISRTNTDTDIDVSNTADGRSSSSRRQSSPNAKRMKDEEGDGKNVCTSNVDWKRKKRSSSSRCESSTEDKDSKNNSSSAASSILNWKLKGTSSTALSSFLPPPSSLIIIIIIVVESSSTA